MKSRNYERLSKEIAERIKFLHLFVHGNHLSSKRSVYCERLITAAKGIFSTPRAFKEFLSTLSPKKQFISSHRSLV